MDVNIEIAKIRECISQIHVSRYCDEDNINKCLLMDTNDPGYNALSGDEIVYNLVEERKIKLSMIWLKVNISRLILKLLMR